MPHRAHVPRRAARSWSSELILADDRRASARPRWTRCCRCSARTSSSIFEAMDGLPVTVRLIDPPLHEFLPDLDRAVGQGRARRGARRRPTSTTCGCSTRCAGCTSRTRCSACAASGSAWSSPACSRCRCGRSPRPRPSARKAGGDPRPEIMIPLVGAVQELEIVREEAEQVLAEVASETGVDVHTLIGTMIEVPRAALTAGQIAEAAEFFSFGTNDLTQMTWGFSRDDVEARVLLPRTSSWASSASRPFETLDRDGVGRLVADRRRGGPRDPARPQARRLRRARRRPRLGALLPRGRPRLRLLLAVPGAGRAAGGRPRGDRVEGVSDSQNHRPVSVV